MAAQRLVNVVQRLEVAQYVLEEAKGELAEAKYKLTEAEEELEEAKYKLKEFETEKGILPGDEVWKVLNERAKDWQRRVDDCLARTTIDAFLSKTLDHVEKAENPGSTTGTKASHGTFPETFERWKEFKGGASNFDYPSTSIAKEDVPIPRTKGVQISGEPAVRAIIDPLLSNFNRIYITQAKPCRFSSNISGCKFTGQPDHYFILDGNVLSFFEVKTPFTLPVYHPETNEPFDLLDMFQEDLQHFNSLRNREYIGRTNVLLLIEQVYGYLAVNDLSYGCVTCYDVTYFLWRSKRGKLQISDPIYNDSRGPTLLQAIYYFTHLIIQRAQQQKLGASPESRAPPDRNYDDQPSSERQTEPDSNSNFHGDAYNSTFSGCGS